MITLLITENDAKVKELLGQLIGKDGGNLQVIRKDEGALDLIEAGVAGLENDLLTEKKGVLYKSIVEAIEKKLIEHVLQRTEGNQFKAARILGINRNTIRAKLRKLGIDARKWKIQ